MDCPRCGFAMTDAEAECPHCKGAETVPPVEAPEPAPPTAYSPASDMLAGVPQRRTLSTLANVGLGLVAFLLCLAAGVASIHLPGGLGTPMLVLATSAWVGADAAAIDRAGDRVGGLAGWVWGLFALLLWIIILPWYMVARDKHLRRRNQFRPLTGLWGAAGIAVAYAGLFLILRHFSG